jgi:hypothetical protein
MIDPLQNNFRCSVAWVQTHICANVRQLQVLQALTRAVLGNPAEIVANPFTPRRRKPLWLPEALGSDRHSCPGSPVKRELAVRPLFLLTHSPTSLVTMMHGTRHSCVNQPCTFM